MTNNIKTKEVLQGLLAAVREFEHGVCQMLAGEVNADQETLGHLVAALREMHRAASPLLHADEAALPLFLLQARQLRVLETLGRVGFSYTLEQTVQFILTSIVDGVRRPGAWEREVTRKLFPSHAVIRAFSEIT